MAPGVRRWKSQTVGFSWPSATTPHRHACFRIWPLSKSAPRLRRVGKRGAWPCLPNFICGAASAPRRRFLSPPGPLLVTGSGAAFWPCPARKPRHGRPIQLDLPRPRLCARPARTGRSARRGPLGRNLPGRQATLAHRRRRRSFPAKHRRELRSRREGRGHYAGGVWGGDKTIFRRAQNLAVIPAKRRSRAEPGPIEERGRAV